MADKIITAIVSQVLFGDLEIEGLMLETGVFAITIQQTASIFQVRQDNAQRDFKALLGESFRFVKIRVENARTRKPENALTILDFEKLLAKLDRKGNLIAQSMQDGLVGLSLHQLFSDAFNQKFDKEDRQLWLKKRQATIESFWQLTDDIKIHIDTYGSSAPQFVYINAFKALSVGLFGKEPNVIKTELQLGKSELNRNHFGKESLNRINCIQHLAKVIITSGTNPTEAIKSAINTFNYQPMDYTK